MKKILAAVLLGTALSITACGGSDEPAPAKTVYVQPEDGGSNGDGQVASVEQEFLYDIGLYETAELAAQPDADLVELGYIICDAFDKGASLQEVLRAGSQNGGLSQDSLVVVAAAASVNFCPEHKDGLST